MKVYIVRSYDTIWGVYATKEAAEKALEDAQMDADFSGSCKIYGIREYEVEG